MTGASQIFMYIFIYTVQLTECCVLLVYSKVDMALIRLVYIYEWCQSGPSCSKLNRVVSLSDVKISILKYGKYIDLFC